MTIEPGSLPPTGQQIEIHHGDQRAVVVEVGGGLRAYERGGQSLIDGYAENEMVTGGRGQTLIPWPNRLEDGRYDWEGESYQLPLSEPETRTAIHGFLRWRPWDVAERSERHVVMGHLLYPRPGWPFWLELRIRYDLDDEGLSVRTSARNVGNGPCPYATGAHPYLTAATLHIDACQLQVRAEEYLPTDDRQLPTGRQPVKGTAYDFREPREIGATEIDYAFASLHRDGDGRFRTRLVGPDGRTVALWQDESYRYVEIFTGDTLPPRKKRTGLGVEPMTMPPNGLRTGTDVVRLEPGDTHDAEWGVTLEHG